MKRKILTFLILLIAAVIILLGVYFYSKKNTIKYGSQVDSPKEMEVLLSKVSKLYLVPNEEPTIATVSDPDRLNSQLFFARAEKGDKVLIFTRANKAILYRPSINKIIETVNIKNEIKENTPSIIIEEDITE